MHWKYSFKLENIKHTHTHTYQTKWNKSGWFITDVESGIYHAIHEPEQFLKFKSFALMFWRKQKKKWFLFFLFVFTSVSFCISCAHPLSLSISFVHAMHKFKTGQFNVEIKSMRVKYIHRTAFINAFSRIDQVTAWMHEFENCLCVSERDRSIASGQFRMFSYNNSMFSLFGWLIRNFRKRMLTWYLDGFAFP